MVILNENAPKRPDCCSFNSMAELYAGYVALMGHSGRKISSTCGHDLLIFDHHFFHLAAVLRHPEVTLSMPGEMDEITSTIEGYGRYVLDHGGSRARNLPSAFETFGYPDEVWEANPRVSTAKWVYVKQFDSAPYPYTIALIGVRPDENGIIVPFSSFPCRSRDLKNWRRGECLHPKQIQPPEGG